jgi:hypothetical protein
MSRRKYNPRSAHKGSNINIWSAEREMKPALEFYHKQKAEIEAGTFVGVELSRRAIAKRFNVPHSTFNKRCIGEVKGYEHASGGPRYFSTGTVFLLCITCFGCVSCIAHIYCIIITISSHHF